MYTHILGFKGFNMGRAARGRRPPAGRRSEGSSPVVPAPNMVVEICLHNSVLG